MKNYVQDAFQALDLLTEETFNTSKEDLEELDGFLDEEPDENVDIIDIEAETEDDLKDNYIGDVILACPTCQSKIFKPADEVIISKDDETLCNVDEECPYCYTTSGFRILGQVAPFSETEITVDDKEEKSDDEKTDDEEVKEESDEKEEVKESFDNAKIELDDTEISIKSKEQADAGMVAPISDDVMAGIESHSDEVHAEEEAEENEDEFGDIDMEDFDEESFEEVAESYLREQYSDVRNVKVKNIIEKDNKLVVESIIRFNNGQTKPTKFIMAPHTMDSRHNLAFLTENINMNQKFIISGKLFNGKFRTRQITR